MAPTYAWIWPKDPRPGNPRHWPRRWRLLDVLTNRGPDIYVGKIDGTPPTAKTCDEIHPLWSGQKKAHCKLCWACRARPWAARGPHERYDFRTRKYGTPNQGSWYDVEYCDCGGKGNRRHIIPTRYWDYNGQQYPANYWHDAVYGVHTEGHRTG